MAFLIRQISHSAEGREIVRPSRVEGDRVTIGRDPASDIHLTDLAVALRHATINRAGPGRLSVTAGERLYVEFNGRKVESGTIDLAVGGEIRIASHLLTVAPAAADAEEIAIDATRVTGEEDSGRADVGRFTLAGVMPGKRPLAWALIALVLGIFVAWPIWTFYERREAGEEYSRRFHADRLWLSGSLSRPHAFLQDNCNACHVEPFVSVRDDACLTCHTGIHDHADPVRLARARPDLDRWGRIRLAFQDAFNLPAGRCVECHTEHQGPQELPHTPQRFCADCHGALSERLPDTRIGDAADFGRLHPEFRPLVLVGWDGERPVMRRVPLDRGPTESNNLKFPHALHLAPTGGVAQMARRLAPTHGFGAALDCADCHVPRPDGVRFQPVNMEGDCAMCHSLAFDRVDGTVRTLRHGAPEQVVADLREFYRNRAPPRPAELGGQTRRRPGDVTQVRAAFQHARAQAGAAANAERAIRAVFSPSGACYDCHVIDPPPGRSLDFRIRPVAFPTRYLLHGWFDHRPHQQTDCVECHAADRSNRAADLLVQGVESCRQCHGGERSSAQVASTCAMCHDYHMDEGTPAMLLRRRVRGQRWESTVIPVDPQPAEGR